MRQTNEELRFVAQTLDLSATKWIDHVNAFNNLDEGRIIEVLQRNKVAVDFEKNLKTLDVSIGGFFDKFPAIRLFYQSLHTKIKNDLSAFEKVRKEFSRRGIEFILIKSADSFPYESDNLDVLIKPNDLAKAVQTLRESGYAELPQVREKHKFLFRKKGAYDELPLHIHTRVEWEGVSFVDSEGLWERHNAAFADSGFFVPSPEDCILITVAHLFFENHEVKLADLFKIDSCIQKHNLDWNYLSSHALKLHWLDALSLTLLVTNQAYSIFYGRTLIPKNALAHMEEYTSRYDRIFLKIIKPLNSKVTPVKIPYMISAIFFLRRTLLDSSSSVVERLKMIGLVAIDVFRIKLG